MTVFHSGQLGNEPAMMQQLQSGALDMGFIQAAELGSRVPHIAAINAPYIVRSTPSVAKFVRHPAAIKLFEVLPQETGTIGLGWGITGMRAIFSAKDLTGLADIKGMKLRINPTPVYRDFYSSLGAAPTPIPTPRCSTPWRTARSTASRRIWSSPGTSASTRLRKSSCR